MPPGGGRLGVPSGYLPFFRAQGLGHLTNLNHMFKSRDYRLPVIPWMQLGNHMESKQNGERNE
jgi:hypothetical protein